MATRIETADALAAHLPVRVRIVRCVHQPVVHYRIVASALQQCLFLGFVIDELFVEESDQEFVLAWLRFHNLRSRISRLLLR